MASTPNEFPFLLQQNFVNNVAYLAGLSSVQSSTLYRRCFIANIPQGCQSLRGFGPDLKDKLQALGPGPGLEGRVVVNISESYHPVRGSASHWGRTLQHVIIYRIHLTQPVATKSTVYTVDAFDSYRDVPDYSEDISVVSRQNLSNCRICRTVFKKPHCLFLKTR